MATDPGDLVLDPTCGSGTTAYVAEQWGRRWITIDTSRVALALARARIMGARYPFYLLADSPEGQQKEGDITRTVPSTQPTYGNIRHGFVYERVPHITLKSIANNTEIDVIYDDYQQKLEPLREELNQALGTSWEEWEIPRELPRINTNQHESKSNKENELAIRVNSCPFVVDLHKQWWELRIARQKEIDASISAKADSEYLYDKPYEDKKKVRVAGPFTVESLSPHRVLGVDEDDELLDTVAEAAGEYGQDFATMILDNLRTAGVQQAHKEDRIQFIALEGWPGHYICAVGTYTEGNRENGKSKRAGIFIGPEFGTVSRPDLVAAAREAAECGFDVLIACAFNFEARTTDFDKLGAIPVLKARMNADLHMADDLKNTGKGNLFVIFGEPDVTVASEEWIVDSNKERIAPYEILTLVSGTDGLAEINGLDRGDLQRYAELSCRGEVWDYLADAAGRLFDTGEHCRGTGAPGNGGVSSVARHCAGVAGGIGNVCDTLRKAGVLESDEWRKLVERLCGNQQNAARADALSSSPKITQTNHYPLTTNHCLQVTVNGVDVFHPNTGEVRSDGPEGIACWFIDTDYNEESFFVRHAYFLGQNDPYKALKTTLKAEINADAWATLNSAVSRPFDKPKGGRIAVKVINHLGDEVMKVFRV
jgi:adenine-specific DNA-methyltransferase